MTTPATKTTKQTDPTVLVNRINSLRAQLQENRQQHERATNAYVPLEEALHSYELKINGLASIGAAHLYQVAGACCVPQNGAPANLSPEIVFACVVKDLLLKAGRETIEKQYEFHGDYVIPRGDRVGVLTRLDDEFFSLECQEESLIEQIESMGVVFIRRADATPEAVLGIPRGATLPSDWCSEKFERLLRIAEGGRSEIEFVRDRALEARNQLNIITGRVKEYNIDDGPFRGQEVPKELQDQLAAAKKRRDITAEKMASGQEIVHEKTALAAAVEEYVDKHTRH